MNALEKIQKELDEARGKLVMHEVAPDEMYSAGRNNGFYEGLVCAMSILNGIEYEK